MRRIRTKQDVTAMAKCCLTFVTIALAMSGCCTSPSNLAGYSYKVSASPEVQIPQTAGKFFIPIAISNDSNEALCFERTGKHDGLVATLEVSPNLSAGIKIESIDLSGLSGTTLKPGRSIFGSNSPQLNTPIGFYVSGTETKTGGEVVFAWKVVLKSPRAPANQSVSAAGATKIVIREASATYLLISEEIPYPSHLEE